MLLNEHYGIAIYVPPSLLVVADTFVYHEVGYYFAYTCHGDQKFPPPTPVVIYRCPHRDKRGAHQSFPPSTIILCNIIQALIILPSFSLYHNRGGPRIIAKQACSTSNARSTSFRCPLDIL